MSDTFTVVMLAGALKPPPLQQELDVPPLCLPLGPPGTVLDGWLSCIGKTAGCSEVSIVVNSEADAQAVRELSIARSGGSAEQADVCVIAEPASWRGTAGLVRDLAGKIPRERIVVVIEANCLPSPSLEQLLASIHDGVDGVVGIGSSNEPAGMYAFRRAAIDSIPTLGYFDLKEQLFPALHASGMYVRTCQTTKRVIRVRDRSGYLDAVRACLQSPEGGGEAQSCRSSAAKVSPSATIAGYCIIEPDAVIGDEVVLHNSVVLSGAVIEPRAVLSHSIAAPSATVLAGSHVINQIIAGQEAAPLSGVTGGSGLRVDSELERLINTQRV